MAEKLVKTIFDWEHFALYLSGGIDFAEDGGKGWRDIWTDKLVDIGIKRQQIYNPCRKPLNGVQFDLDNEARLIKECREKQDWDKFDDVMSQIMHIDLRLVDLSSIILVNFPKIGETEKTKRIRYGLQKMTECSYPLHPSWIKEILDDYTNMRIPTYGTVHEIVVAHLQRKPIFVVWEDGGRDKCSAWIMRLVGYRHVFPSIDTLIQHLVSISNGKTAFNAKEWLLLSPE